MTLPSVGFGAADALPDWRQLPDPPDPDDELLSKTPPDVVAMLGFDPLELTADAWKESEHPRGQPGNAGEFAKTNSHEERLRQVPEHELGESPIPNGMVRRFHYTSPEHLESIRKNGLLWRKSVSHKSGDPEALWSSPESDLSSYRSTLQNRPVVEFADLPEHWQGNPFAAQVDIPPRQILAIHEPWHEVYRYVKENPEARATLNRIAPGERADSTYRQAWERLRQEEGK